MKMAANLIQVKICSNGMIAFHRKNPFIMLQPTEVQSLIKNLVYATKAISRTSDPRIIDERNCDAENTYLEALIAIVVKTMCKEMYAEVYKRCDGCVNEEPGQQSHDYCLLVELVNKATECFNGAFSKVDIYFAKELCFEKVSETIPVPVRDIDLYMNRENY